MNDKDTTPYVKMPSLVAMPLEVSKTELQKSEKVLREEAENHIRTLEGAALDDAVSAALKLEYAEPISTSETYAMALVKQFLIHLEPDYFVEEDGSMQAYGWNAQVKFDADLLNYRHSAFGSTPELAIARVVCLCKL